MAVQHLNMGDVVYARVQLLNDEGEIPDLEEGAVLANPGSRGVIVNIGHLEDNPDKVIYLVRFESNTEEKLLGPPTGCWEEELIDQPLPEGQTSY